MGAEGAHSQGHEAREFRHLIRLTGRVNNSWLWRRGRGTGVDLDSFFRPVRVEWDHEAAMTPLGQLPFFIDFLKTAGLFDALVADCPLRSLSPKRAEEAGRSRHGDAFHARRPQALRAYRGAALRRRA